MTHFKLIRSIYVWTINVSDDLFPSCIIKHWCCVKASPFITALLSVDTRKKFLNIFMKWKKKHNILILFKLSCLNLLYFYVIDKREHCKLMLICLKMQYTLWRLHPIMYFMSHLVSIHQIKKKLFENLFTFYLSLTPCWQY